MSGTRHESDSPTVSFGLELSQVSTLNGRRPTGVYHFYWTMGDRLEPKWDHADRRHLSLSGIVGVPLFTMTISPQIKER
jgi:hypothetical protein